MKPDREPDIRLTEGGNWKSVDIWFNENIIRSHYGGVTLKQAPIGEFTWDHGVSIKNIRHLFRLVLEDERTSEKWKKQINNFLADMELLG